MAMITVASTLKTDQPSAITSPTREICGLGVEAGEPLAVGDLAGLFAVVRFRIVPCSGSRTAVPV